MISKCATRNGSEMSQYFSSWSCLHFLVTECVTILAILAWSVLLIIVSVYYIDG